MLRRWFGGLVSIVSCVGLAGLVGVPASAAELSWNRLSGATGVETSIAVAKHVYPSGWNTVYVASNRNPVDALPAATIGNGPVVLTDGKALNLGGVKPGKVVLLGGPGAVPATIEAQAKDLVGEGNVTRLWGADRNQTAAAIARYWAKTNGAPATVYVTKNAGAGSPDAVAGSVLRDGPIVTFTSDASAVEAAAVVKELQPAKVVALGGTGPVSDANLNAVAGGLPTERLAGANRYETAFVIAQRVKAQNPNATNVYLASGTALKDAMVAGAANDGVILLTPANAAGVNDKATALGAQQIHVIGGTGVLPENTAKTAAGDPAALAAQAKAQVKADAIATAQAQGLDVYEGTIRILDRLQDCKASQEYWPMSCDSEGSLQYYETSGANRIARLMLDSPQIVYGYYCEGGGPYSGTVASLSLAGDNENPRFSEATAYDGKHVVIAVDRRFLLLSEMYPPVGPGLAYAGAKNLNVIWSE